MDNLHKLISEKLPDEDFKNLFINYIMEQEHWDIGDKGYVAGHEFIVIETNSLFIKFSDRNKKQYTEPYFISKNYDEYTDEELNIIFNRLKNLHPSSNLNSAIYRFLIKTKLSKEQIFKFKYQLNFNYIISGYPEYRNDFINLLYELINKISPNEYFEELDKLKSSIKDNALNYTDIELLHYIIYKFILLKELNCNELLKIFNYLSKFEIKDTIINNKLNDEMIKKCLNKLLVFKSTEKKMIFNNIKKFQWNNISNSIKNQILILEKFENI